MFILSGTSENDSLVGTQEYDFIDGGAGNDTLIGQFGDDILNGGDGDDVLESISQSILMMGGAGNDSISGWVDSSSHVDGGSGNDTLEVSLFGIGAAADGGAGDDVIKINLYGGAVLGGEGNDLLRVSGNGLVDAGYGDDTVQVGREVTITGGYGRDVYEADYYASLSPTSFSASVITDFTTGSHGDQIDLGSLFRETSNIHYVGINPYASLVDSNPFTSGYLRFVEQDNAAVLQYLFTKPDQPTEWLDVMKLEGVHVDALTDQNFLVPVSMIGNYEVINTSGDIGSDSLYGADGNDSLRGLDGNDWLYGGYGGGDTLIGGRGFDVLYGMSADDLLRGGAGADSLFGGTGNDSLLGDSGDDYLDASLWHDLQSQDDGHDVLYGGAGRDTVNGGLGDDIYYFGRGSDVDIVYDLAGRSYWADSDTVQFHSGVNYDEIWLARDGYDLKVNILGTQDTLILKDWHFNGVALIENFRLDNGLSLTGEQVNALVDAMASMQPPAADATHLSGSVLRELEAVLLAQGS